MSLPIESYEQLQVFFWILVRVSILIFLFPIFGAKSIPLLWKAGASMVLAILITPLIPPPNPFPQTIFEITTGLLTEAVMGFLLAFTVRMFLSSAQMAGYFIAFQMGLIMASTVDPETGAQSTVLSQFLYLFTILFFLAMNGHHLMIHAMVQSFHAVPPCGFVFNASLAGILVKVSSDIFVISLKMAAPIMLALFLSNLCLGIVARTVPQLNILMVGFPINIGLGLILFGLVLSNLSPFLTDFVRTIGRTVIGLIGNM
jgi:flagellar biosynthetic protein FliR